MTYLTQPQMQLKATLEAQTAAKMIVHLIVALNIKMMII